MRGMGLMLAFVQLKAVVVGNGNQYNNNGDIYPVALAKVRKVDVP
jgi:hypothetical protein